MLRGLIVSGLIAASVVTISESIPVDSPPTAPTIANDYAMPNANILEPGNYNVIPVDSVSDYWREKLIAMGWHGMPGDNREAIYVPHSIAMQTCGSDADCDVAENGEQVTVWYT